MTPISLLRETLAVVAVMLVLAAPSAGSAAPAPAAAGKRPNVLFIAVDDLRPQLGCYGQTQMVSPNIDRLAAGGTVFDRAYCMVPTCGASRASLMTGVRPSRNRFVTHLAWADKETGGLTTMNTHFKANGYVTVSNGKVFHHPQDSAAGWSEAPWRPDRGSRYHLPASQQAAAGNGGKGPAVESADAPDADYPDAALAERAMADLRRLKAGGQPFFLAVGFAKPHLPFVAPKKYWDLYDRGRIDVPPTYHRPENAPDESIHNSGELRGYAGIPKQGVLPHDLARELIHGYYACVSFTDAQVGRVLDELKRLGLDRDTVVVLWGDHGWNLGEHTMWNKHCCYETSMRIPLIVRAPGMTGGQRAAGLVESIDVYPTLCELAGLPVPPHVQGASFVPLLRDPARPGKDAAIGRFGAGDTVRTPDARFTEYSTPDGRVVARMLYDHAADPAEDVNVAGRPAWADRLKAMADRLHAGMGRDWPMNGKAGEAAPKGKNKKKAAGKPAAGAE